MKKFAKNSLIAAGIMGAVGCLLCLVCTIFGGRNVITYANDEYVVRRLEERGGSLARRLLRLTGQPETGLKPLQEVQDIQGVETQKTDPRDARTGEHSGRLRVNGEDMGGNGAERQIDVRDVRKLNLMLGAGTFTVSEKEAGNGETIDLYIQGDGGCDFYVENETLYVECFKGVHTLGSNLNRNNITLKFPYGMSFEEVEAEVGAGIMEFYDIKAKDLEASVGAGSLSLYRTEAGELSVEIGAGELYAQETAAREAELTVSLGSCTYLGTISHSLDAECDMGSMEFRLKGKETDYNYEIECSGGNIEMDSFEAAAFAMEKKIDNRSDKEIELSCSMGNISIHFEE